MDWILVESIDDAGARLEALRVSDGATRELYVSERAAPLQAAINPAGTRVAINVPAHSSLRGETRMRLGLVNLERGGLGWLKASLDPKWRLGRAQFDDSGQRLAFEGAYDGVPISDIYVERIKLSGNSVREEMLAGAGNPRQLGCAQPRFLPKGERVLYLRKTQADGAWEVCVLDLQASGDSAWQLEGRAPSVLSLTLSEGADVVPDVPVAFCAPLNQLFWVGRARGGTRQCLRTMRLGTQAHSDLGRQHRQIESLSVAPEGELVAYAADGQVWLSDVESGATVSLVKGEPDASHTGLMFDLDAGRLLFCTSDEHGARLRAVSLADRRLTTLHELGERIVLNLVPVESTPEINARLAAFGQAEAALPHEPTHPAAAPEPAETPQAESEAEEASEADEQPEPTEDAEATDDTPEATDDAPEATDDVEPQDQPELADQPDEAEPDSAEPDSAEPDSAEPEPAEPEATESDEAPQATAPSAPPAPETAVADDDADAPTAEPIERLPTEPPADGVDPRVDFGRWMKTVPQAEDPGARLRTLEGLRDDANVRETARLFLGTQRRRAAGRDAPPADLVFALAAAAHLELREARRDLIALCEGARPKVERGQLPTVEAYFALAALEQLELEDVQPFDAAVVFAEHAEIESTRARIVGSEGEGPAARYIDAHARQFLSRLRAALDHAPAPAEAANLQPSAMSLLDIAAAETERRAAEEAQAEEAQAEEPQPAESPADDPILAAARAVEAEADRIEVSAIDEAARAELARLEADRLEAIRIVEAAERRAAEKVAQAEAEALARIEAEAQAAAEEVELARLREEAEARAAAERAEAEARAAAEQAEAEAAERERAAQAAEWARAEAEARAVAEAAEQARLAQEAEWAAARAAAERQAEEARLEAARQAAEAARREAERKAAEAAEAERQRQIQAAEEEARAAAEAAERAAAAAAAQIEAAEHASRAAEAARTRAQRLTGSLPQIAPEPEPEPVVAPTPSPEPVVAPTPSPEPAPAPAPARPQRDAMFNPLTGPLPSMPKVNPPQTVRRARPDEAASVFDPSAQPSVDEDPVLAAGLPQGAPPITLRIAGTAAAVGGISQVLVAANLGSFFATMGVIWLLGGLALFADRKLGWLAGLGAYLGNVGWLFYAAATLPFPEWVPREMFWVGGGLGAALCLALLNPAIPRRYKGGQSF